MSRNRWWAIAVVAVLVVGAVVVVLVANGSSEPSAEGSPSPSATEQATDDPTAEATETTPPPSPVPTPAPSAAPVDEGDEAVDLVAPFVEAGSAARQDPAQPLELDQVATGAALQDLLVQVEELAADGLSQTGSPTVVSAEVLSSEPDADPPTATVLACLDYSEVDVVNASGESIKDDSAEQRVATILGLVRQDDAWLVAERTFPDDPGR